MSESASAGLFERLRSASDVEWRAYIKHPFVLALGDGCLPEACFRRYLTQDYLFLIQFARAYGLAVYKAETLDDIRRATAGLAAIVDREMGLHVAYCAGWGLSEAEMAAADEADATMAYTRYVLEKGLAGDLLDLQTALAPCIVGYAEIGRALSREPAFLHNQNPYKAWIEAYAAEDYQAVAAAHATHMDVLMARRDGAGRFASLLKTFRQATRLEAAFWEMGLNASR